jgi:hypothetical protein
MNQKLAHGYHRCLLEEQQRKQMMYTDTAVNSVVMITPNQPTYRRFSVEVTHSQKRAHKEEVSRRSRIAVICFIKF